MNDSTTHDAADCEARAEDISLLAAGCLTAQEEQALRAHFLTCDACHERCDQLQSLCLGLRAAKPECDAAHLGPSIVTTARPSASRRVGLVAAVVASALVLLGLLSIGGRGPAPGAPSKVVDVAHDSPTETVPAETKVPQPTLLALRRAAEESDEALDRLFAQTSAPMLTEPLSSQSLWQETLR